jgi:hypothetical protein
MRLKAVSFAAQFLAEIAPMLHFVAGVSQERAYPLPPSRVLVPRASLAMAHYSCSQQEKGQKQLLNQLPAQSRMSAKGRMSVQG